MEKIPLVIVPIALLRNLGMEFEISGTSADNDFNELVASFTISNKNVFSEACLDISAYLSIR